MSLDLEMEEILKVFFEESFEGLDAMESGLLKLDAGPIARRSTRYFAPPTPSRAGPERSGSWRSSNFTHSVETLLDEMRNGVRGGDAGCRAGAAAVRRRDSRNDPVGAGKAADRDGRRRRARAASSRASWRKRRRAAAAPAGGAAAAAAARRRGRRAAHRSQPPARRRRRLASRAGASSSARSDPVQDLQRPAADLPTSSTARARSRSRPHDGSAAAARATWIRRSAICRGRSSCAGRSSTRASSRRSIGSNRTPRSATSPFISKRAVAQMPTSRRRGAASRCRRRRGRRAPSPSAPAAPASAAPAQEPAATPARSASRPKRSTR